MNSRPLTLIIAPMTHQSIANWENLKGFPWKGVKVGRSEMITPITKIFP